MTLTQTATITKQVIILTLVVLVLGTVSFIGYKIWYSYYLSTLPPVEEKPNTKFGVLPQPIFPKVSVSSSNFSYTIDTTTGSLPKIGQDSGFEKIIKVYYVTKPVATLLSSQKSQNLAEKFGIINTPQILSETSYQFSDKDKTLLVDLDSGNFLYLKEASSSATAGLDDDNKLVSDFETILSNLGSLKDELSDGRSKVLTLKEGSTAQISLWPRQLDKKIIYTSDFNKSLVNATVVSSASNLENYLSLNFTFWPVDETTFATYPTKNPDDALNDLKLGKGVIIIEPQKPQVSITSLSLGYYLSENYSQYLEPIYIFEGPQFVAYVPAISSEFIEGTR